MKTCPSCGYRNPGRIEKCAVCGAGLGAVPAVAEPAAPKKRPGLMLAAGLALLAAAAFFYFSARLRHGPPAAPAPAGPAREPFSYAGVVYSLDKMSEQRYLPEADKLRVLHLLSSPEEKVSLAAARAVGAWTRSGTGPEASRALFEGLLGAAAAAPSAGRRQAALEAGLAVVVGFDAEPYLGRIRTISAGLASSGAADLRGAGFFLSSMAGLDDLATQMRRELSGGADPEGKLYAACALSRLGDPAGHSYLAAAVSGPVPDIAAEAISCLSYSASPEAGRLLAAALGGPYAESAKNALMLREQLAIIKK